MEHARIPGRVAWLMVATGIVQAGADTLNLNGILELADRNAFGNRIALAREDAAIGQKTSAMAGFVPVVRAEAGLAATDEPLSSFATRLGQRRVSMASFDPSVLNNPEAIAGWNAALVAEVPLVNLDAWSGFRAASKNLDAERTAVVSRRHRVHAEVVDAWFSVGLARKALDALDTALAVAKAYQENAVSGVRNETAIRSDLLKARVEVGSISAQLAKARTDAELARRKLALLAGVPDLPRGLRGLDPSDSVLAAKTVRPPKAKSLEEDEIRQRAEAARANLSRARAGFLPRLNGVARIDWKGRASPFSEDPSWTVGLSASWNILGGAGVWGGAQDAAGKWREAEAGLDALKARQEMESAAEVARLEDARERLAIAKESLEQAKESHRIARRRYEEGVATATERIEAGAVETRIRLELVSVRREIVSSLVAIELLEGRDPAGLAYMSSL